MTSTPCSARSFSRGHPDKLCDYIADCLLDAHLTQDPRCRVVYDVMCRGLHVVLSGEIRSRAIVPAEEIVRESLRSFGPRNLQKGGEEICVDSYLPAHAAPADSSNGQGAAPLSSGGAARNEVVAIGYATDETPELMPLPILLAHRLTRAWSRDRHLRTPEWLPARAAARITVHYRSDEPVQVTEATLMAERADGVADGKLVEYVRERLAPLALGDWLRPDTALSACWGVPLGATDRRLDGMSGRHVDSDMYGGVVSDRAGGLSGRDPSRADRCGRYFARWVARRLVTGKLARRARVQVAYHPGSDPLVLVGTYGTGDAEAGARYVQRFDFRTAAIAERLDLHRPIYRWTSNHGHFGRAGFPWEE